MLNKIILGFLFWEGSRMDPAKSILFEPVKIMNMELRNRFIRSATYDGCAENGYVTEKQLNLYETLAEGGVGLIITGITYVHHSGQISKFQNSISSDEFMSGLQRLASAVHERGARIAVQLFHAGREARFPKSSDRVPIAPSFLEEDPYFEAQYRAMTESEIWEVVRAFGDGAERAREAGFDAIQIHGAHAYLLSQFLSPYTNRRRDEWGGSLENRLRIHREIYQDIRQKVGEDYPVLIKIGVQDGFPSGLEFGEGKRAAEYLAKLGFDALEISQGLRGPSDEDTEFRTKINTLDREAYFRNWCRQIKNQVEVPVMIVGGLRTFKLMEEVIQNKEANFISLSRPLIMEPGIINDWKRGDRHRAKCISCNQCFESLINGETLECAQLKSKKY
jgi:2,4-dienoyl-CoA reductase-like NADH-dependent reductase (Old Yellow Enzyme family)